MLSVVALLAGLLPAAAGAQAGPAPLPIPEPEVNEGLPPGLIQYSDIAARLNEIAAASDRVSVEVLGQSAGGRDLYLATVADPTTDIGRTKALRRMMLKDPAQAQKLASRFREFRVPVFLNCSIHGNEYEGVDACIATIERLAFGDDAQTRAVLDNVILLLNVVQNPDGRVLNTRQNANGFDLNRDFITNSQPETALVRDLMVEWNPMVTLDLHGYVNPMLIEPTTPPHNPNYEYDLYIESALGQALAMEDGVLGSYAQLRDDPEFADDYQQFIAPFLASEESVIIPFRDWEVGDWDDWPPIFAPMYAMYHGSYGHTLEAPLTPRPESLSPEAKAARARVNTEAHIAATSSMLDYVVDNKLKMVTDQLEVFRRGVDGIDPVPVEPGFVPGYGPEDNRPEHAGYPEAYVIPVGDDQASALAAERLVDFLIAHGVEVESAKKAFDAGGRRWPAGSYIVSMRQPRRGLANTMLELGYDISELTPQMYDISGWSHAELWGATVITVPKGTDLSVRTGTVDDATVTGGVAAGHAAAYTFELDSETAIAAANEMLAAGVALRLGDDGTVVVPADARTLLGDFAARGITFTALASAPEDAELLETVQVAAAVNSDEAHVLGLLGFEADAVNADSLNDGSVKLADYDVLMVSSDFRYRDLSADAAAAFQDWLAGGGGVIGISSTGAALNAGAGLLDAGFQPGPACAVANGVVAVDNGADSPIVAGFSAEDTSFVYDPLWFTDLGDGVRVDQRFDTEDVLLAGHWLGDFEQWIDDNTPGGNCGPSSRENSSQTDAAGQPAVISGTDETGARVVLFGTQPMFRDHPKKLYQQVAQALYWISADQP
ncbi:MAG TPA: M14 family zinc carboxypeptidase [Euzebyales bacterium]|nr:M14 family zinc carboxypeptidase [Euzebyales bacterium]